MDESKKKTVGNVNLTSEYYGHLRVVEIKLDTLLRVIAKEWIDNADKAWMPEPPESVLTLMAIWEPEMYQEAKQKADEIKAQRRAEEQANGDGLLDGC